MGCSNESSEKNIMIPGGKGGQAIEELIKADSLEEANRLLQKGAVFLSVFYNQAKDREEYIMGKLGKQKDTKKPIGFRAG